MSRFPTAGPLASWARFAPGITESAGKNKGRGATGRGNPYLARALGEAAVVAGRSNTFLGERYRRIARRRGKKRATRAVQFADAVRNQAGLAVAVAGAAETLNAVVAAGWADLCGMPPMPVPF